jgi:hypothetical protein
LKECKIRKFWLQIALLFTIVIREASHVDFVHEKRHMFVSLETPPPPPLETSHIVIDILFNKMTV